MPKTLDLIAATRARMEAAARTGAAAPEATDKHARAAWINARLAVERPDDDGFEVLHPGSGTTVVSPDSLERILGRNDLVKIDFFVALTERSKAVCLIALADGGAGTGSLITSRLLITNNHVIGSPEEARTAKARFNFDHDDDAGKTFYLDPDSFFVTSPANALDYTIVALKAADEPALQAQGSLPLAPQVLPVLALGEPLNIIQHPEGQAKQYAVRENETTALLPNFVQYRTDTNPGSSGSPVFDSQWRMVALHHSGVPRTDANGNTLCRDGRVWEPGMGDQVIDWIANEGVRIDAILKDLHGRTLPEPQKALMASLPAVQETSEIHPRIASRAADSEEEPKKVPLSYVPPPRTPPARRPPPVRQPPAPAAEGTLSVTIPLRIQVSIGAPIQTAVDARRGDALALPLTDEAFVLDDDYASRPGYDEHYLGIEIPLPTLTAAAMTKVSRDQTSDADDNHVLRYHHFSVVMNRERRMQFFSACNTTRDKSRMGSQSRKALGRDRWIMDPRIPRQHQIQNTELYVGSDFDLGHVVRREDAYWGEDETDAEYGNFDTFHYTNATPQSSAFNRSNTKGRWGLLENHIATHLKSQDMNMSIFAGPVLRADDPVIRGVKIPVEFWKVVAVLDDDGSLSAFAFVLSQKELVEAMPREGFAVGQFRAEQRSLAYLESVTDVRFPDVLHEADVLRATPHESLRLGGLEAIQLRATPAHPATTLANGA